MNRKIDAALKAKIALEALRERATVADLVEDQAERVQKAAGPEERHGRGR